MIFSCQHNLMDLVCKLVAAGNFFVPLCLGDLVQQKEIIILSCFGFLELLLEYFSFSLIVKSKFCCFPHVILGYFHVDC